MGIRNTKNRRAAPCERAGRMWMQLDEMGVQTKKIERNRRRITKNSWGGKERSPRFGQQEQVDKKAAARAAASEGKAVSSLPLRTQSESRLSRPCENHRFVDGFDTFS